MVENQNVSNCPSCGSARRLSPSGAPYCKTCNTRRGRRYAESHRERLSDYKSKYRKENDAEIKVALRKWRDDRDPLRKKWNTINDRCHSPTDSSYKSYGAKGISVHSAWMRIPGRDKSSIVENSNRFLLFKSYIENVLGPKPSEAHTLDRINTLKDYEPGNLRWATPEEQAQNKRSNPLYRISLSDQQYMEYRGNGMTLKEFSILTGINLDIVKYRWLSHPHAPELIISNAQDNRYYQYQGHTYNITELSIIGQIPYSVMFKRIRRFGWNVKDAVERPLRSY